MAYRLNGDLKAWHKVTLDFTSARNYSENAATFRDHRLDVTFRNGDTGETLTVPGFFAADGDAADSGATGGNVWRVNFNPPSDGDWSFEAHFRRGNDIAADPFSDAPNAGAGIDFDGTTGRFAVTPSDKGGDDFRAKGMILQDEGTHYLQHQGDGDYFVRGGPGIPENFLANPEIDGTSGGRHGFETHRGDFDAGDPTWDGGRGNEIIGAVNYLAEQGQNAIYVLTNTAGGDGKDVWPWAGDFSGQGKNDGGLSSGETDRFSTYDVSKLAQWDVIFDHMDEKGIYKNVLLQETENDQLLNGGTAGDDGLSVERMVYMREMVARFGHNNGLQWNLGEENTNTDAQRLAMADYMEALDPYGHLVTIHSYPGDVNKVYRPLLGDEAFDGTSFQVSAQQIRARTIEYRDASDAAGDPWVLAWDEDSSGNSIIPLGQNDPDSRNEQVLREAFWGHLTAGGSGGNWYIKQPNGHSLDQNYDTFRSHESVWEWTAAATSFFNDEIPFWEMTDRDGLTSDNDDFVMAKDGEYYVVYLPYGEAGDVKLDLRGQSGETFEAFWYDPRNGGELISDGTVAGGAVRQVGGAPNDGGKDWVLMLRNADLSEGGPSVSPPAPTPTRPAPQPVTDGDPIWEMEDGRVVMQAEDGTFVFDGNSNNSKWKLTTQFSGDKGDGVMLWTGGDLFSGSNAGKPQTAPMTYQFTVDEPGEYYISLRAVRPVTGEPSDRNNDFFVQTDGEPWKKVFFGGPRDSFEWGTTFDVNHVKSPAKFTVTQKMIDEKDGIFTIGISGRSEQAGLDEIQIQKGGFSRDDGAATSPLLSDRPDPVPQPDPTPDPTPEPDPRPEPGPDPVVELVLYDAEDDRKIATLTDGGAVDIGNADTDELAIVASIDGVSVGSVAMRLNGGSARTERIEPYALFGDDKGDLSGGTIGLGDNTISVTFKGADGRAIVSEQVDFELLTAPDPQPEPEPEPDPDGVQIVLEAFDTDDDSSLGVITDGGTLDSSTLDGGDLAIAAQVTGVDVGVVSFSVNGGSVRKEGIAPYSLFGDIGKDLNGGTLPDGDNTIAVTVTDKAGRIVATDEFEFRLSDETPAPQPGPDPSPLLRLFLADSRSNETLADITNGGVLDSDALDGRDLTAYAVVADGTSVGSVRFAADGDYRGIVENISPFALFGDVNGDYRVGGGGVFDDESADLRLTAYSQSGGRGDVLGELEVELFMSGLTGLEPTIDFL